MVSLAALRWLADTDDASFLMLERDGTVLLTTGPVSASDARLRRAQACAIHSPSAVSIVRDLIRLKLAGQEQIARDKLRDATAADTIAGFREQLESESDVLSIRHLEGQGGQAYWSAWRNLPIDFPRADLARVPDHWKIFGVRQSPLSGSARLAATPANAALNFLYAVLEAETRLAIAALGLDPGMGLLHFDTATRDSLACDLMEPIRPKVDSYLLDWISRSALKREWFFEKRDGNCRLMPALVTRLAETIPTWRREISPLVEWFADSIAASASTPGGLRGREPGSHSVAGEKQPDIQRHQRWVFRNHRALAASVAFRFRRPGTIARSASPRLHPSRSAVSRKPGKSPRTCPNHARSWARRSDARTSRAGLGTRPNYRIG